MRTADFATCFAKATKVKKASFVAYAMKDMTARKDPRSVLGRLPTSPPASPKATKVKMASFVAYAMKDMTTAKKVGAP